MNDTTALIQPEQIERVILLIRGQKVILDRDLATLYGVETKNLNKAVRRNLERFPADFMYQLTLDEAQACTASRLQFGTLKRGQNIKYLPRVFTQEGVTMLSSVLRSPRAAYNEFGLCRARTFRHNAWHDLRTVIRRMEGVARPDSARTLSPERRTVRPIPGDGRQP